MHPALAERDRAADADGQQRRGEAEWTNHLPGAASPPVHVHHRTDEGFYVLSGAYRFLVDGNTIDGPAGSHVLVRAGSPHTFWNAAGVPARCLIILTPPEFAQYFRELSLGLADAKTEEDSIEVRRRLSARFDIEVVGPPIKP